jgi:hypothetical protein
MCLALPSTEETTMRIILVALLVTAYWLSGAAPCVAEVLDPSQCSALPCDLFYGMIFTPYGESVDPPLLSEVNVTVRNWNGQPVPNAYVEVVVGTPGNHLFCAHAVLSAITDDEGQATLNIAGGGCTEDNYAVRIIANGVPIRQYENLKSPDYADGPDGEVSLPDFVTFGNAMMAGAPGCTDYFNDGVTGLDDFVGFSQGWAQACDE